MKKENISPNVLMLTKLSVLLAIIILMGFTPIGYLRLGTAIEITLITIPVIIGAIDMGPKAGTFLGFAFGLTSFLQCVLGTSAFGVMLLSISPLYCILVTIPTRTLMGFLTGLLGKALKPNIISYAITGLCGSLLNTLLFMTTLMLCYYNTDYIRGIAESLGSTNIFTFLLAFVGINGLVEAVTCTALSAIITKALKR